MTYGHPDCCYHNRVLSEDGLAHWVLCYRWMGIWRRGRPDPWHYLSKSLHCPLARKAAMVNIFVIIIRTVDY